MMNMVSTLEYSKVDTIFFFKKWGASLDYEFLCGI